MNVGSTTATLESAWGDYRRRRNSLVAAIVSWTALIPLVVLSPDTSIIGQYWWVIALPIFVWVGVASLRITLWRCPRCHDLYFTRGIWFGNLFISRCYHCALPKWSTSASEPRGA